MAQERSPLDIAADVFVYAPVGLALRLSKALPELADQGRARLGGPLTLARMVGESAVQQGRRTLGERLQKAAEPYFGPGPGSGPPSEAPPQPNATNPPVPGTAGDSDRQSAGGVPSVDALAIPGYATLSASQVLSHLSGLGPDELRAVAAYEGATRRRKTILARTDHLLAGSQ